MHGAEKGLPDIIFHMHKGGLDVHDDPKTTYFVFVTTVEGNNLPF